MKTIKISEQHKKVMRICSLIIFVLASAAIFWFIGRPMLKFVSDPDQFRTWVDSHGMWGRIAFVGMMILQIIVAIIPGEPLEIVAGYAFGIWEGTALCILGAIIGSAIIFLFVRYLGVKAVEGFFPRDKIDSINFLKNEKKLNLLVFAIFFIPGTPKDLLSYFIGLTKMKFSSWMAITATARIPSIITSTIGGDALGMQNYTFAIIVFLATLTISIIGICIYNRICTARNAKEKEYLDENNYVH